MFTYNYSVSPEDTDMQGSIKVTSLCRNIINSIGRYIKKEGFGIDVMRAEGCSWILSRYVFEFDERPGLYSPFDITVWDGEPGNILVSRCISISDSNHKEIGRGSTDWCIIDRKTRRLIRPSAVIRHDPEMPQAAPCGKPERVAAISIDESETRKVRTSDCDFNGHMNNIRYVEMMYDMIPSDKAMANKPLRLSAFFHNEATAGQTLTLGLGKVTGGYDFVVANAKDAVCTLSLRGI